MLFPAWVEVNYKDPNGHTPLSMAAWGKWPESIDIAAMLLDAGAKPFGGMSQPGSFEVAVRVGDTNMLNLLLKHMTNVCFSAEEQQEVIDWAKFEATGKSTSLFLSNYFNVIAHTNN